MRDQGQREKTVRDGCAEWPAACALGIDMDPLVVTGGVRKAPHALLGHVQPIANGNILALAGDQIGKCGKGFHAATVANRHGQGLREAC